MTDTAEELEERLRARARSLRLNRAPDVTDHPDALLENEAARCISKQAAELRELKARHNPEVCVDVQEHCEKLEAELRLLRQSAETIATTVLLYQDAYETKGGGHLTTGMAWDRMNKARNDLRTALDTAREAGEKS